MKRVVALLAALLLGVPHAKAATPAVEFPDAVKALAPTWLQRSEALAANSTQKEWYPEAAKFLQSAKDAQAQGRVRSVLFDLETFEELVVTGQLLDEAQRLPSDAERKSFILQRTAAWHADAKAAWRAYRDHLHEVEGDVHSVRGMELALYSADQALSARLLTDERENVAREFPKQPGVERGFVLALVRSSHTALLDLQWAEDVLGAVAVHEGLPPRLNETAWQQMAGAALAPPEGDPPAHLKQLEDVAAEARERNESVLAIAVNLAEQRAARATSIYVIYGDATSRGKDVTADAARAMGRQLENTSMQPARDVGLLGVFTADAIDRAIKTRDYADQGLVDLGIVIAAWAGLDHEKMVTTTLGAASPVRPAEPKENETPVGLVLPLAALAVGALLLSRRR